jgi:hypothetical protein
MTGQVKEDLISRLGEMGVAVADGRLGFCPHLVSRGEFMSQARTFHFYGLDGQEHGLRLDPGTMAFTTCQAPVVAHRSGPRRIEIALADGSSRTVEGLNLDAATSAAIFERTATVRRLDVFFGLEGGE